MNKRRLPVPGWTGLEVRAAASEKLMNSRMRASAPMSCNEHIWPFSLFPFSLNLSCKCASSWRKSIAIPPVSVSRRHLPNSCKCNISHPDILDKHKVVEQCSTGKSGDRKSQNRKRAVCFHIWQAGYILGEIRRGAQGAALSALGAGQEGGNINTSSSVTTLVMLLGCSWTTDRT